MSVLRCGCKCGCRVKLEVSPRLCIWCVRNPDKGEHDDGIHITDS